MSSLKSASKSSNGVLDYVISYRCLHMWLLHKFGSFFCMMGGQMTACEVSSKMCMKPTWEHCSIPSLLLLPRFEIQDSARKSGWQPSSILKSKVKTYFLLILRDNVWVKLYKMLQNSTEQKFLSLCNIGWHLIFLNCSFEAQAIAHHPIWSLKCQIIQSKNIRGKTLVSMIWSPGTNF